MAHFGWLVLCLALCGATLGWGLAALNGLGTYNIGGVPNSPANKLLLLAVGGGLAGAWYWLVGSAPFTITLK